MLRYVGLVMIVAAHLTPPALLFQLRNFDVPLMVLVSGASYRLAYRPGIDYPRYVWKRFKRLVFPVWLFLIFYFAALAVLAPGNDNLRAQMIAESFMLFEGIGYVWIIRVFLLMALVAPLLYRIHQSVDSDTRFVLLFLCGLFLYQGFNFLSVEQWLGTPGKVVVESVLYYLIPYALVYALGIRLAQLSPRHLRALFAGFLLSFIGLAVVLWVGEGDFVPTQDYKYPVTYYYLSYALMVSLGLWLKGQQLWDILPGRVRTYVLFTSRNSIWIYLWHIPLVKLSQQVDLPFVVEYPLTIAVATLIAYVQVILVGRVLVPGIGSDRCRKNLRMILTG
nr:acyltransferase [Lewinella sp. JB7]